MAALLGMEVATFRAWSSNPTLATLDLNQRELTSLVVRIYKALVSLFHYWIALCVKALAAASVSTRSRSAIKDH